MKLHPEIKSLMRLDFDPGDPWGSAMSHWFAIAGTLYREGMATPEEWRYHPGLFEQEDPRDWPATEYAEMLARGQVTLADVLTAGQVMDRYVRILVRVGRDY